MTLQTDELFHQQPTKMKASAVRNIVGQLKEERLVWEAEKKRQYLANRRNSMTTTGVTSNG